jgi:hypothetical protein
MSCPIYRRAAAKIKREAKSCDRDPVTLAYGDPARARAILAESAKGKPIPAATATSWAEWLGV